MRRSVRIAAFSLFSDRLEKSVVETPVFVRLHFQVDAVSEDAGQNVVVEFALHDIGVLGVEDELADARNGRGGHKDAFPVLLEDLADVVFDAIELFDFAGVWKAGTGGVDHRHRQRDELTVAGDPLEFAIGTIGADVHRLAEGIVSLALNPGLRDRQFVRTERLSRGKWPHAATAPVG